MHVLTLRNASMHVITYCISVLPIYWAFAIFGVLNYGPYSEKFNSIGHTLVTLFSLLNGDDIYGTFTEIEDGQYPLTIISRIYIFSFVTLFVTSVLNVFIFIIEDSYRTAKLYSRSAEENIDEDHRSLHKTSMDSNEILATIFSNLEIWQERMEKHVPFDFNDIHLDDSTNFRLSQSRIELEDTESEDEKDEDFLLQIPRAKRFSISRSGGGGKRKNSSDHSPNKSPHSSQTDVHDMLLDDNNLKDFTNATFDNESKKEENEEQIHIKLEEIDSNKLQAPPQLRRRYSGEGVDHLSDPNKIFEALQNQLLHQKKQFDIELEKREQEIKELKHLYDQQNDTMMHLFGSLKDSLKRK